MLKVTNHEENEDQNRNVISPHTHEMAASQKEKQTNKHKIISASGMLEKSNHCAPLVRMENGAATMENSVEVSQNIKRRTIT